jgi:hypothetical protein
MLSALLSNTVLAGDCSLTIDRTACPGKEAEAKKPYDGKNPTEEKMPKAQDAEACLKAGEKAAKIVRKGTLSKIIPPSDKREFILTYRSVMNSYGSIVLNTYFDITKVLFPLGICKSMDGRTPYILPASKFQ